MGAVLWAETAGAVPLDKVFANSTALDGESVVVYFRALCAVSQEDLTQDGDETRDFGREFRKVNSEDCFLLHRLVECASINIRKRVRPFFVWRKIWAVVSQHLVGAACLPQSSTQKRHSYVAMYAVDGLRKLADEVVGVGVGVAMQASSNASASASTTGAEAIRPLNSVLRGAESASVRELAVACIAHVMGGQPLGEAGWGAALHALAIAASDPSPVVAGQALDAALPACQALYVNHSRLEDCISTLLAVVSRTSNVTALYSFQVLARQIAEHWNSAPERMNPEVWITLLSPLAAVARGDDRAEIADTAAAVLFQILQTHGRLLDDNDGPRHHEKTCRGWSAILKSVVFPLLSPPPPPPPAAAVEEENEKCIGNDTTNSAFMQLPRVSRHQKCPEGVARIARHASTHLPDLWSLASTVQSKDCIALLTVEFLIQNFILYQSNGSTQMTLMRVGIEQASLGVDIFGGGESNASWDSLVDVLVQSISTAARAQGNSRMNLRSGSLTTILMARWIAALVCNRAQKELGEKNVGRLVDALAKEVYENAASVNKSIEAIGPDWKHTNKDEQGSSPEEGSPEDGSPKDGSPKSMLLRQEVEGGRLLLSTLRTIGFKDRLVHWALIIIRNCSSIVESLKSVSPTLRSALLRDAVDALCDGIENGNGNGNVVGVTMIKMDSSTKSEIFALASKLVMSTDGSLKKSVQRLLKVYGEDALRKL